MADIKLRKKAPFFCRNEIAGKKESGGKCCAVLIEDDGIFCKPCGLALKAAHEKFNNTPIVKAESLIEESGLEDRRERKPFWPLNDDDSICTPPRQEVA